MSTGKPREVRGFGPSSARVMFVGEAPGRDEYLSGRPFYGRSGQLQRDWLSRHDVDISTCYLTNIVKLYQEGNPDPTYEQIIHYSDSLHVEIASVKPWLIVAVGRFASRWFLGESADLDTVHGIPFAWTNKHSRSHQPTIILPIYHPAFGLHSASKSDYEPLAKLTWDYQRVAKHIKLAKVCKTRELFFGVVGFDEPVDHYAGQESYLDCTGHELADHLHIAKPDELALDTEGIPSDPWSVQISTSPGTAYILRCIQPDFSTGIRTLQSLADSGTLFITHQASTPTACMYDTVMCRSMGLELRHARVWDTMYAAYLLRTEAKGLKHLATRWLGMDMGSFDSLIGDSTLQKIIAWVRSITAIDNWIPQAELIHENDGTYHYKKYQSPLKYANRLLNDLESGKLNNKGEPVDPVARVKSEWPSLIRNQIISRIGPLPHGSLDDIQLSDAIYYAGRDPDATLRLKPVLTSLFSDLDLLLPFADAMDCLPSMENMQENGMYASRHRFVELSKFIQNRMDELQFDLIHNYNGGNPINPNSPDHIRDLMHRRRLKGEKRTVKTNKISTGKKSIDHLRHTDPAMALVMDWRELATIRNNFVKPSITRSNPNTDQFIVRGVIQPATTDSRRLSMTNPTLLNIPSRTEIGRRVRSCYEIVYDPPLSDPDDPDARVFGAWDFSGQEARVAAHISQDPDLINIFRICRWCGIPMPASGLCSKSPLEAPKNTHLSDIHSETAMRVFGIPFDRVDKWAHRMPSKTAFFGVLNGMSGAGLLDQFRMYIPPDKDPTGYWLKLENCEALVNEITKRVYSGLSRAMVDTRLELAKTGVVRDLFGFPRYLPAPAVSSAPFGNINAHVRAGFNHKIQGTAQGMTQSAQTYVYRTLLSLASSCPGILFHLQIHDELLYSFPRRYWSMMNTLVMSAMTLHYGRGRVKLSIPVEADGHMATNWGELKG